VLTSEYLLIASLGGGFFTFFALNRGGIVVFIEAGFCLLIINLLAGAYQVKKIPLIYWITTGICAYLLLVSVLFNYQVSHYRWMANLVRMLGIVFTIHCLSQREIKNWTVILFIVLIALAVCWQGVAHYVFKMTWGTFTNPHYLSSFTMLALPFLVCGFFYLKRYYNLLLIPIIVLDIDLLLKIESRPAVMGLAFGTLFFLVFLTKGYRKWISLLLLGVLSAAIIISDYGGAYTRLEKLIVSLAEEERIDIWLSTWDMLKDNSLMDWATGNGIGSFRKDYRQYAPSGPIYHIFPHLHFIEILYENGIFAVVILFGGITYLIINTVLYSLRTVNRNKRILTNGLLVSLLSWLFHSGITFPFYSKYSMYSLAFILGTLLAVTGTSYVIKSDHKSPSVGSAESRQNL
jgi:hypothetical protein